MLAFILSFAGPLLVQGALVKIVRSVHEGTRPEGALALLNDANSRLLSLVGASLIYSLGVIFGLILLIVPGLLVAARWSLMAPAIMLEGKPGVFCEGPVCGDRPRQDRQRARRQDVVRLLGRRDQLCAHRSLAEHRRGGRGFWIWSWVIWIVLSAVAVPFQAHALSVLYYRLVDPQQTGDRSPGQDLAVGLGRTLGARVKLIAGNWKMYKGPGDAAEFCLGLREEELEGVDVVVAPPYVSLAVAVQLLAGTEIAIAAQNVHWEEEGAYTGEISPAMLLELGVYGAIVGHSERRQHFGENDESVGKRARGALAAGMFVIGCVGETEEERERGETESVLQRQVSAFEADDNLVLAYEPVWAIGTGKTATPEIAQEAHAFIKSVLDVPVLYGGSVKPDNAAILLSQPGVDGALVGGASLELESFIAICRAAANIPS